MKCEVKVKVKSIRCFHVKSRTLLVQRDVFPYTYCTSPHVHVKKLQARKLISLGTETAVLR